VADALGRRRGRVISGGGSRQKRVLVAGIDLESARTALAALGAS
jgi:uncharacterized protein YggU (UPF0235/DUF167 family)